MIIFKYFILVVDLFYAKKNEDSKDNIDYELAAINRPKDKYTEGKEGPFNYLEGETDDHLEKHREAMREKFMMSKNDVYDHRKKNHFFGFAVDNRNNESLNGEGSTYNNRKREHFRDLDKNNHFKHKLFDTGDKSINSSISKSYNSGIFSMNGHYEENSSECNCHYLPLEHEEYRDVESEERY